MTDAVWICEDREGIAPINRASLTRAVRERQVGPGTLLVRQGEARPAPAGELFPHLFASPPSLKPLPRRLDWSDTTPHPWRRYGARLVDTGVIGGLLLSLLFGTCALFLPEERQTVLRFFDTRAGIFLAGVAETLLMIPLNALALARCGSTPGKALFGIRLRQDARRPDLRTLLRREWSVVSRGQALGLPFLDLVSMARAYRHLKREGRTPWDEAHGLMVHHRPGGWGMYVWLAFLLLMLLIGYAALLPL